MNRSVEHVALAAFNTPLWLHPRKAEVVGSFLATRLDGAVPLLAGADLAAARAETERGRTQALNRFDGEPRGPKTTNAWGETYQQTRYLYRDGVALVSVEGTLVNRGAWIGSDSGMTSYEGVRAQIGSALADPDVREIILDIDSHGGEATGAFEMADFVRSAAGVKPIVAVVDGMAASAAYAMASGASRIVMAPTSWVGSIGVVMLHLDQSARLAKAGVKPTLIFAGAHKVDGNPYEALPETVRADFQAEVDQSYADFVATVAKGRPMSEEQIRATQARVFQGSDALSLGLADGVGGLDAVMSALATSRRGGVSRGSTMSSISPAPSASAAASISPADHEAALAQARETARAEGLAAGRTEGATAERARVQAILDSEEGMSRPALARHFAFKTDMAPEAAVAALSAAAGETASAGASPLSAAMTAQRPLALGPGGGASAAPAAKSIDTAGIYARRAAAAAGR